MPTLQFKGKTFVQNHHLAVKYHQLVPKKELSLTDKVSLHDNLIIQGDNLKALKALLPTYAGKIKCIYIDPPYNTGNENWVYNDNVNSPMIKDWLGKVVDKEDLTRHDKWLCLMMPRLKLLRELLSEDGAIFISIDDNEEHTLRCLLDEIFGEQNFIANAVWFSKYTTANDAKNFSRQHEYVTVYCKNIETFNLGLLPRTEEMNDRYSNPDKDKRGVWKATPLHARSGTENSKYRIKFSNGVSWEAPPGRFPAYSQESLLQLFNEGRLHFGKDGKQSPNLKTYLTEVKQGKTVGSLWKFDEVGSTHDANEEIATILNKGVFATPKTVGLIKRCVQISTDKNSIILDSFAGSGTTAQAVLELNKEDGGNRKFILVEQEDYANTITAERVRRVIKGVKTAKNENLKKGTGGTFSYFELGNEIEMESILRGKKLPTYEEFARYLFYTATGEEFKTPPGLPKGEGLNSPGFIGESAHYEVYLLYKPDVAWLKNNALTLEAVKGLPKFKSKMRLVFAPSKYVDDFTLMEHRVDYCQLPYEIYRLQK
jgi:adenine-specific DNA-methyltransferase